MKEDMKAPCPNVACISDVGCQRDHNEDSYLADSDLGLWVVADGMGGHEGGEVASRIAIQVVQRLVGDGASLQDAIQSAHHEILAAAESGDGKAGMGSTVVAVRMDGCDYDMAWVGDSRGYLWNGRLRQLTRDHSFVQKLLDAGAITDEEALDHPDKNVIAQALGAVGCDRVDVDCVSGRLYRGEKLVLCSDGLTGEVEDAQIAEIMAEGEDEEEIASHLVDAAIENGGSDNVTVIVLGGGEGFPEKPRAPVTVPFDARELNARLSGAWWRGKKIWIGAGVLMLLVAIAWGVFQYASPEKEGPRAGVFQPVRPAGMQMPVPKQARGHQAMPGSGESH